MPCIWNRSRQKRKTPKRVQDLSYSRKKGTCEEVINFDSRAPSTVQEETQLNESLLWNIESSGLTGSMWYSLSERHYSDYDLDPTHIQLLKDIREQFLQNLKVPCETDDAVLLVHDQRREHWYTERMVRLTASDCHTIVSLQSTGAISIFLNRKLWKTDKFSNLALRYGLENESVARQSYEVLKGETVKVTKTGLWVSSCDPELAVVLMV